MKITLDTSYFKTDDDGIFFGGGKDVYFRYKCIEDSTGSVHMFANGTEWSPWTKEAPHAFCRRYSGLSVIMKETNENKSG